QAMGLGIKNHAHPKHLLEKMYHISPPLPSPFACRTAGRKTAIGEGSGESARACRSCACGLSPPFPRRFLFFRHAVVNQRRFDDGSRRESLVPSSIKRPLSPKTPMHHLSPSFFRNTYFWNSPVFSADSIAYSIWREYPFNLSLIHDAKIIIANKIGRAS